MSVIQEESAIVSMNFGRVDSLDRNRRRQENIQFARQIEGGERGHDVAEDQDGEEGEQYHGQKTDGQEVAQPFDRPEIGKHLVGNGEQERPEGEAEQGKHRVFSPSPGASRLNLFLTA